MTLSILCVTKNEPHAAYFLGRMRDLAVDVSAEFCVAVDGGTEEKSFVDADRVGFVRSEGFIESVLDQALDLCRGRYVLRLDDDEVASEAMVRWISKGLFYATDHWKFPRMHLWPDAESVVMTKHLWPDVQTRLSIREKAGGRKTVHAGSPFGGGEEAPVAIEHHKFLVRSYADRLAIAKQYDAQMLGAGTGGMMPFSLPEDAYDYVLVAQKGNGAVPWSPEWTKDVLMKERVS